MIEIRGAEQFGKLAKELKEAGDKDLKRELYKAVGKATRPLISAARKSATEQLPRRGGLNKRVAQSRFSTNKRQSGVRVTARNAYSLRQIDRGIVRHPVYGNTEVWVNQPVNSGWWSEPLEAGAPTARRAIQEAMDEIAKKLDRA